MSVYIPNFSSVCQWKACIFLRVCLYCLCLYSECACVLMLPACSVFQKGRVDFQCQQTAFLADSKWSSEMVNCPHTGETLGKWISPTDLEVEPKYWLPSLAPFGLQLLNQTLLEGHDMVTARAPQMIRMALRGCLRTASSLWFLFLSLDLSTEAITLGCCSDVLHHHCQDNGKTAFGEWWLLFFNASQIMGADWAFP